MISDEKVVTTTCACHCGSKCIVKVHVRNGVMTSIEAVNDGELQIRPCARGRAYRQRVYAKDRLQFPLKRTGKRGEGKFARITWDEALDTVAGKIKGVKDTYGPSAILLLTGGGDQVALNAGGLLHRLFRLLGGCSTKWGTHSNEGGRFASLSTYGTIATRSTYDDLPNSRLIIMWGWNPATTVTGHACRHLWQAKEKGTRIVSIDPRYTNSAATFADQWLPIIPGADAALLIAMAYVIIRDNLQDQAFLDKYTLGFDKFKDYVEGKEDGVPKTPFWAAPITGLATDVIENLAREYATLKPAALMCGISPGRTAYGEQYHRAAITLSAMTGNIGIRGGSSAGVVWASDYPFLKLPLVGRGMGVGDIKNPVDEAFPPRKYALPRHGEGASSGRIHFEEIADAILGGKAGGYPADYKLLYIVGTSYPNQYSDINKAVKALQQMEFIVVHEQFMTPSAKFADIVLPVSSIYERNDVVAGQVTPPFYGYLHKMIEPLDEAKSHFEIAADLAGRLGIPDFSGVSEDAWLREIVGNSSVPDHDAFKERGYYKVELSEPYVAFRKQIEDPVNCPFPTPSGKIEIFSQQLADMNHPEIPPIPKYIETWESRRDAMAPTYPLQLINTHTLRRAHTQFETIPWLRELQRQTVAISPCDARARNIQDGDEVRVFNDRGSVIIPATITERIMPGVVDIPEGAWFAPDENGTDRGGSANVLTRDVHSPGGALASNTCLVEVEKIID